MKTSVVVQDVARLRTRPPACVASDAPAGCGQPGQPRAAGSPGGVRRGGGDRETSSTLLGSSEGGGEPVEGDGLAA